MTATSKVTIIDAARQSREISAEIQLAITLLMGGEQGEHFPANGYGVLHDPSTDHLALLFVRSAIERALMHHAQTRWPSDADYDNA